MNEVAGIPADDVQLDKSFTDDLDIDSLSMVEVVVAAEEKFGVKIPDDDVKNLKTVGDAVAYIAEAPQPDVCRSADAPQHADEEHDMSTTDHSVVVTGLGATTPLGGDVAVDLGRPARRPVRACSVSTEEWAAELPVQIAAPVAVDPLDVMDRVEARKLDRSEQFALIAAREAWADAGSPGGRPASGSASSIASGIGGVHDPARPVRRAEREGRRAASRRTPSRC